MATINGLNIKNLKKFKDHEGFLCYQGNIYLGKKKIAFWSQDFMGGYDTLRTEAGISSSKLYNMISLMNQDKLMIFQSLNDKEIRIPYSLDLLMDDLIRLTNTEKQYRKAVQNGYIGILQSTDGYHVVTWKIPSTYAEKDVIKELDTELKKVHESFYKNKKYMDCYYTEGSFDIGEPILLEQIME